MEKFFTFSIGDVLAVIALIIYIMKLQRWIDLHQIEHEILITDYMDRKSIKHLPTRARK